MNRKIALDLIMTALVLVLLAYRIIGGVTHELIGLTMLVLFVLHNWLNVGWYKTLGKGRYNGRRIFITSVNVLLFVSALVLICSGILHSKELFGFTYEEENSLAGGWEIHSLAAYWMFLLMSIHLGFYWKRVINRLFPYNGRRLTITLRLTAALVALWGIKAFFSRNLASKLILHYSFDFWHTSEPAWSYMASYLTIMVLFAFATYYLLKLNLFHARRLDSVSSSARDSSVSTGEDSHQLSIKI